MSEWYEIKDQDDVELSEDGKTLDVLFKSDNFGNHYVEIPVEYISKVLPKQPDPKPCIVCGGIETVNTPFGYATCKACCAARLPDPPAPENLYPSE